MSKNVLTNLNFNGNEIQNVVVHKLGTPPSVTPSGKIYFDTTTNSIYVSNGTTWYLLAQGSTSTTLTGNRALTTDANGRLVVSTVTDTELSQLANIDATVLSTTNWAQLANLNQNVGTTGTPTWASATVTGPITSGNQVTNKTYVDNLVNGAKWKDEVVAATTGPITLATDVEDGDLLDNVTLAAGNRILVKDQATAYQNGIYIVALTGAPTRATDCDETTDFEGAAVYVQGGTANGGAQYVQTADAVVVGTDPNTWVLMNGASNINAGAGLDKTGNTIFVGDGAGIKVNADSVEVELAATSGLSFDAVGVGGKLQLDDSVAGDGLSIASKVLSIELTAGGNSGLQLVGVSPAKTLEVVFASQAETEAKTITNKVVNPGDLANFPIKKIFTPTLVAGVASTLTHNLNTKDVIVAVYDSSDNEVIVDVVTNNVNSIDVTSNTAATYRVVVIG